MDGLEKIFIEAKRGYYSELVLWVVELITIIIGIVFVRRQLIGKLFLFYLIFDFVLLNIGFYLLIDSQRTSKIMLHFIAYSNCVIAFVEILVYYFFFIKVVQNKLIVPLFKTISVLFVVYLTLTLVEFQTFEKWSSVYLEKIFASVAFMCLLVPCILYFFEILTIKSDVDLVNRPSFWIVTGIFFYSVIAIPYNLVDIYLLKHNYPYKPIISVALYMVPFTMNFVFLSKAFLCRRKLTM